MRNSFTSLDNQVPELPQVGDELVANCSNRCRGTAGALSGASNSLTGLLTLGIFATGLGADIASC